MNKTFLFLFLLASFSFAGSKQPSWISKGTWELRSTDDEGSRFFIDTSGDAITFDRLEDEGNTIFSTLWYRADMVKADTVTTIKWELQFDPESPHPMATTMFRMLYYQFNRRSGKILDFGPTETEWQPIVPNSFSAVVAKYDLDRFFKEYPQQ